LPIVENPHPYDVCHQPVYLLLALTLDDAQKNEKAGAYLA
jgi:hypothetical protein